jgi:acyl-CoA-dependent ceramide synthase
MLLILALYAVNPSTSNPFYYCIFLAYPLDTPAGEPVQYGKGKADFAFVAFYTIVLSFTREFLMQRMIRPLAIRLGIMRKAKQARFMEQFYTAMYFAIFGPFGLYVMRRSPVWYFNTNAMFEGFPHRTHEAVFKAYYLLQASYWAQQAIVLLLMLEKPRKDFKELVLHHIVTLALIWLSYRFHFTYMGIAVYITMDISDFFLAVSFSLHVWVVGSINADRNSITDIQNPQLPQFTHHRPLLWSLHRRLVLLPPLPKPAHSLGHLDLLPHSRPL